MEGAVHHVYGRGNGRRAIFRDDRDLETYLALLARVVVWKRWRCMAYCLMPNHVHLLIETPECNLGTGMQWLHGRYAQGFNERHGSNGHLFQGRYGAVRVTSDQHLWTVAAYIALNPVEAGLCEQPDEWPWSSHKATLGAPSPGWLDAERLLGYFAAMGGEPRQRYAAHVVGATLRPRR